MIHIRVIMVARSQLIMACVAMAYLAVTAETCCADDTDKPAQERERATETSKKPSKENPLEAKLARRVSVETESETLTKFIERISEEMDVNIAIDYDALDPNGEPRLGTIKLKDIPLGTALKVTLRTVGLDYHVYEHFIYVSTPLRLRQQPLERLETRFYDRRASTADTLPKVALINPGGAAQQSFGSILQLAVPVNPALVGEPRLSEQAR